MENLQLLQGQIRTAEIRGWLLDSGSLIYLIEGEGLQELLRSLRLRILEEVEGASLFDDIALIEEDDAVGYCLRKVHLVGNDHHG